MPRPMPEFVLFVLDSLQILGAVSCKAMFGGYGIYKNSVMFALIVDDSLYFKVNEQTKEMFVTQGLLAFSYQKQGKTCYLNYYQCPSDAFDDEELMLHWANIAYNVALQANSLRG